MTPTPLIDMNRSAWKHLPPSKMRYDLIVKHFGELSLLETLPDPAPLLAAADTLDPEKKREWQRAIAEEILLRHACGLAIPEAWISAFADVQPLEDNISLSEYLRSQCAAAMFPLLTNMTGAAGAGHTWVFNNRKEVSFIATVDRKNWHGDSWQLVAELARRAMRAEDHALIRTLATRWIITGTCDGERIGAVEIGNKFSLDTRRNWLIPAMNTLLDSSRLLQGKVFRSATVGSALNLIAERGFQTAAPTGKDLFAADVLHSFVSKARPPVLLTALAARPQKIHLWCSSEFGETGMQLREILLPAFLPNCRIEIHHDVSSRDIARAESDLRPALAEDVLRGRRVLFNITNGNLIQRLAAASIAGQFPEILVAYRDHDDSELNLTAISYAEHPPVTWPNAPTAISKGLVNRAALIENDNGKMPAKTLLRKLFPEKVKNPNLSNRSRQNE